MFPTNNLFGLCPSLDTCLNKSSYPPCLFSHQLPRSNPPPPSTQASTTASVNVQNDKKRSLVNGSRGTAQPPSKKVAVTTTRISPTSTSASSNPVASTSKSKQPVKSTPAQTTKVEPLDPNVNSGPPRVPMIKGAVHTPLLTRQKMVNAFHAQFVEVYTPGVLPTSLRYTLASRHALEQEQTIYNRSTKPTYRNGCISALARLKKRQPARSSRDTGTIEEENERESRRVEEEKGRLTRERCRDFVHDRETLRKFGYVLELPSGKGGEKVTDVGEVRSCDRCKKEFVVKAELENTDRRACNYHFGKMISEKIGGVRQRVWSCCPAPDAAPCQIGPHVFKDEDPDKLHSRIPFIISNSLRNVTSSSRSDAAQKNKKPLKALDLVALDCELLYTLSGLSLARLTVISSTGSIILDEHIKPPSTILDLNTRFSGIQTEDLEKASFDLEGVRNALGEYLDEETIVVGHGVENDLKALRLVHDKVIDTAILFPHPNGGTWRYALRTLTKDYLKKFIQDSDPTIGHSAKDDAEAALELVRYKVKEKNNLKRN